jgi:orotate phosphoribosyltransferase
MVDVTGRIEHKKEEDPSFLEEAIRIGAIQFSMEGFMTKSQRLSPYFFNAGLFHNGLHLEFLARHYAAMITASVPVRRGPLVIFGPPYKGIPLAVAVTLALVRLGDFHDVSYSSFRKEEKTRGDKGVIVGAPLRGANVLLVDDVMTSGGTAFEAHEFIVKQGGSLIGCAIAFDRQERGIDTEYSAVSEFTRSTRTPVFSLTSLAALIAYMKSDKWDHLLPLILEYQKRYGAT